MAEAGELRLRGRLAGVLSIAIMATFLAFAASAQATGTGSITSYDSGLAGTQPLNIVSGPDGNLWFTDAEGSIGRAELSGNLTVFTAGLNEGSSPLDIVVGPDGNLWFTDRSGAIGRITPTGTITEFSMGHDEHGNPVEVSEPADIVVGPDGNLWFTNRAYLFGRGEPAIGRISPTGTITEFLLPDFSSPRSIVVGPDGNLWFTNRGLPSGHQSIGKITPSGTITEYALSSTNGGSLNIRPEIVSGPGGALWFTEEHAIGKITPSGTITRYTAGLQAESKPEAIVVGPDGNLWFTDDGGHGTTEHPFTGKIGKFTPSGTITEYGQYLAPNSITAGPDGNIWVSDYEHVIYRVSPSGQFTYFWLGQIEDPFAEDLTTGPGGSGIWFVGNGFNEEFEKSGVVGQVSPVGPSGTSPLPTVEVEVAGEGSAQITSSPAGINCPSVCATKFAPGTEVTLTATAAPGTLLTDPYLYMKVDNPCPVVLPPVSVQSATCHFTVNGDAFYRAYMEPGEIEEESGGGSGTGSGGGSQSGGGSASTPSPAPPSSSPAPRPKHKALKCRKGFKKQKVHGKAKCVKVKKKRHRR